MGALFSSSKRHNKHKKQPKHTPTSNTATTTNQVTDKDRASLELRRQRDKLQQYTKQLQNVIAAENSAARKFIAEGNKQRALLVLQRKKYQYKQLDEAHRNIGNIEQLVSQLEYTTVQQQVYDALQVGTKTLQHLNSQLSLEDVERLMSESREAVEYQNRVSDTLAGQLSDVDLSQVDQELAEMEREIRPIAVSNVQTTADVPQVTTTAQTSTTTITSTTTQDDIADQINALPTPSTKPINPTTAQNRATAETPVEQIQQSNLQTLADDKAKLERASSGEHREVVLS